jgi:hypothetical protein
MRPRRVSGTHEGLPVEARNRTCIPVAKILLSDWVRGRIPYFVLPPEHPEELNATEAKKKDKAKANQVDFEAPNFCACRHGLRVKLIQGYKIMGNTTIEVL